MLQRLARIRWLFAWGEGTIFIFFLGEPILTHSYSLLNRAPRAPMIQEGFCFGFFNRNPIRSYSVLSRAPRDPIMMQERFTLIRRTSFLILAGGGPKINLARMKS